MYYSPSFATTNNQVYNESVYHQLKHLKCKLRNGAGDHMQLYFPEGFLFINSLYGLSWCNSIKYLDNTSPIYHEGIQEIDWAIREVISKKAKASFDANLPLTNGAFYTGWTNYLLGSKLSIQDPQNRKLAEVNQFKKTCLLISQALADSKTPYLESYGGLSWPADITCAVASLKIHDKINDPMFTDVIGNWIDKVKQNLEPELGLIPHETDAYSGKSIGSARGSSQSLILNFLYDIDQDFANQQFDVYKSHFLDYRFGLPGIREYPMGVNGNGDIDSGPIILDIGGAASIVGQRTMYKFDNLNIYQGLRNSIEAFGVGFTYNKRKKYVFGQLPIADAFICWSNSIELKNKGSISNWRTKFQLISIILLIILIFTLKKILR